MKSFVISLAASVLFTIVVQAAEPSLTWPQFRGPDGTGVADQEKPPVEFSADKNVKWKISVPSGISSPIIVADKLIITAFDQGKLFTIAYDRNTGKELWRADAHAKQIEGFHKVEGSPAASTPASDGKRIVSYFGSCGLLCYDLNGKELWKYDLPTVSLFGNFGSGVSPIIADGKVILVRDQTKNSKIYAINLESGKLAWEKDRQSPISYCTPTVWSTSAGKQIVAAGHARMVGYDLKTGDQKWTVGGIPSGCTASPMSANGVLYFAGSSTDTPDDKEMKMPSFDDFLGKMDKDKDGALSRAEADKAYEGFFDNQDANKDGKITRDEWDTIAKFMSEGKNTAFALKEGGTGELSESQMLWKQSKGLPYIASAIVYRGQCLMIKDGGIVTAYDATSGASVYQGRAAAAGKYYASPVAAGGHIYFTTLDGAITVLQAGSDKPVVVAKNPPLDERTAATPAIADNTLYVRTDKHLYAFANTK